MQASPPFDRSDADIILCSSDNVEFFVHKVVLRMTSAVFEDMFSIPQPADASSQETHPTRGIPVVNVSESGKILDYLLRLCYPTPDPMIEAIDDLAAVLMAAQKYNMQDAIARAKKSIFTLPAHDDLRDQTLRLYVTAIRLNLDDLAGVAALACKNWQSIHYIPEMDSISSGALYRLLRFRRAVESDTSTFCKPDLPSRDPVGKLRSGDQTSIIVSEKFKYSPADTLLRTSDNVDVSAHRWVLNFASREFAQILSLPPAATSSEGLQVYIIDEDSVTLRILLQLCYPMERPEVQNFELLVRLHTAASKYDISFAKSFAKESFLRAIHTHPFRAYFIAMKQGWEDEAKKAAECAAFIKDDEWIPEMEEVPASVYRQLLDYRWECRQIVHDLASASRYNYLNYSKYKTEAALHWSDKDLGKNEWAIERILVAVRETQSQLLVGGACALALGYSRAASSDEHRASEARSGFLAEIAAVFTKTNDAVIKLKAPSSSNK